MMFPQRYANADLLARKAQSWVDDARIRFSAHLEVHSAISAFQSMIKDVVRSHRSDLRLGKIAHVIDSHLFRDSLTETVTTLAVNLLAAADINLMDYPGLFEAERQRLLARFFRILSSIGLPSSQVQTVLVELNKMETATLSERTTLMESHLESLEGEDGGSSGDFLRQSLGLVLPSQTNAERFKSIYFDTNLREYLSYHLEGGLIGNWPSTRIRMIMQRRYLDTLLRDDKTKELMNKGLFLLNSALETVMRIPLWFGNIQSELEVVVSSISDICSFLEDPNSQSRETTVTKMITNLAPVVPQLEAIAQQAMDEVKDMRGPLIDSIHNLLPPKARVSLVPRLVELMDRRFVRILETSAKDKYFKLLEAQINAFIHVIGNGQNLILVADLIDTEIARTDWQTSISTYEAMVLRTAFEFLQNFEYPILSANPELLLSIWSPERIAYFRRLLALFVQFRLDPLAWAGLAALSEEKIVRVVSVLSSMVERRHYYIMENTELMIAQDWLKASLNDETIYSDWIEKNLFALDPVGLKFQVSPPWAQVALKAQSLYSTYRRRIAGTPGELALEVLRDALRLPSKLARIEIELRLVRDSSKTVSAARDSLEAAFRNYLDLLELTIEKKSTENNDIDFLNSLDVLQELSITLIGLEPSNVISDVSALYARITNAKQSLNEF